MKSVTVWRGRPISDLTLEEARQALDDAAAQIARANTMADADRAMILALGGRHDPAPCLAAIRTALDRAEKAESLAMDLKEQALVAEKDANEAQAEVARLRQDQSDWRKGVALIAAAVGHAGEDLCCVGIAETGLKLRAEVERLGQENARLSGAPLTDAGVLALEKAQAEVARLREALHSLVMYQEHVIPTVHGQQLGQEAVELRIRMRGDSLAELRALAAREEVGRE